MGINLPVELLLLQRVSVVGAVIFLVSCAAERTVVTTDKGNKGDNMLTKYSDNFTYVKDENGVMLPQSDKRSELEEKNFSGFDGKSVGKKDYTKTKAFSGENKEWGGSAEYKTAQYAGREKTADLQNKPYYVTKQNESLSGKQYERPVDVSSKLADIGDTSWDKGNKVWEVKEDARTMSKPKIEPVIMSKYQYARKTVEETNALLGRGKTD